MRKVLFWLISGLLGLAEGMGLVLTQNIWIFFLAPIPFAVLVAVFYPLPKELKVRLESEQRPMEFADLLWPVIRDFIIPYFIPAYAALFIDGIRTYGMVNMAWVILMTAIVLVLVSLLPIMGFFLTVLRVRHRDLEPDADA